MYLMPLYCDRILDINATFKAWCEKKPLLL